MELLDKLFSTIMNAGLETVLSGAQPALHSMDGKKLGQRHLCNRLALRGSSGATRTV